MTEVVEVKQRLIMRLERDFPQFRFRLGRKFMFRPARTICYPAFEQEDSGVAEKHDGVAEKSNRPTENEDVAENNDRSVEKSDCPAEKSDFFCLQILHEVGHALLEHKFYATDLERLKMERAAWEKARELGRVYGVEYDEQYVESALDSYRDWLHARSRCPRCGVTRFQDDQGNYHCLECDNFCTKCIKNVDSQR